MVPIFTGCQAGVRRGFARIGSDADEANGFLVVGQAEARAHCRRLQGRAAGQSATKAHGRCGQQEVLHPTSRTQRSFVDVDEGALVGTVDHLQQQEGSMEGLNACFFDLNLIGVGRVVA